MSGTVNFKLAYLKSDHAKWSKFIEELLARVPEVHELAVVCAEQFSNTGSADLGPADWLGLARRVNQIFREDSRTSDAVEIQRMALTY